MDREKILIIGGGGHAKVVIDAALLADKYMLAGIIDNHLPVGKKILGIKVLGNDSDLQRLFKNGIKKAFIAVGSVGDCSVRKNIYKKIKAIGFDSPAIVHPAAVLARDVFLGEGTFVAASATINVGTRIGEHAIINTASSIDHDCQLGNFVHIAPGARLSGGVTIGDEAHIGTGANIIQNIKIGKRCVIGAGTTVLSEVKDGKKYYGI